MNSRGVATVVRGWVGLYTRGMPAAVRAARRDEVDDDLWCQQQEAAALGRAAGSLGGEMLLRLVFGIPADISWRLSNRSRAGKRVLERSTSMSARVIGILSIIAGASWTTWALRASALGESAWAGSTGSLMNLLFYCGALGLLVTALSLAWQFQEQLRRVGIVGAVAVSLGAVTVVPPNPLSVLLPAGSALLVWDLARISVLPRWIAVVHAASAVGLLVAFFGIVIGAPALGIAFALAIPYVPSWIAIGASLFLRGVPRAHEPAAGS